MRYPSDDGDEGYMVGPMTEAQARQFIADNPAPKLEDGEDNWGAYACELKTDPPTNSDY